MSKQILQIDRRAFLKTAGAAALLLPALPIFGAGAGSPQRNPRRLCVIFYGNGVPLPPPGHPDHADLHWFPHQTGANFKLNKPLAALEPMRGQFSILGGLSHPVLRSIFAHNTGGYFLTGADESQPMANTVSMDQVHAQFEGVRTRYPSLVLASEGGVGDFRKSHTLSYSHTGQPIVPIATPRNIYDELFGVDRRNRQDTKRAFGRDRSVLDAALGKLKYLTAQLNAADRAKVDQYHTAVRNIEKRLDRAEEWIDVAKPHMPADRFNLDADPRQGPEAFLDNMYELMYAAFLSDSTRSITFMKAREGAGGIANNFPKAFGLKDYHSISHDTKSEDGFRNWATFNKFLSDRFAGFLQQMAATDDPIGEGSLLDNTIVLYGSGTSLTHTTYNYPLVLAGGKNMGLKHGSYHNFQKNGVDLPLNNLLLTLLIQLGAEVDRFGDSNGTLDQLIA
jgi:hypothetical protein